MVDLVQGGAGTSSNMNANEVIASITPNTATLVTLLNPQLAYEVSAELAMEALASDRTIRELVIERGLMPSDAYDALVKASASID